MLCGTDDIDETGNAITAEFVAVTVAMLRGFWKAAAMTLTPFPAPSPSQLADQLDAMLAGGTHPQLVGQWVAANQSTLLAALRLAAGMTSEADFLLEVS